MKLFHSILFIFFLFNLSAQAELDRVRAMFAEPNSGILVEIWKGHLEDTHPVEFYLGRKDGEVMGYYRIISSGDEYTLEGEMSGDAASLSEYDDENTDVGILLIQEFHSYKLGEEIDVKWYNLAKNDMLEFQLEAVRFSDYPPSLFNPEVKKFSRYENDVKENVLIEQLNKEEIALHIVSEEKEASFRLKVKSIAPIDFELSEGEELDRYNEINGKLRKMHAGVITFFDLENELKIKPETFAAANYMINVEYPITNNEEFNKWITDEIDARKIKNVQEIKTLTIDSQEQAAEDHFRYRWTSWTEIDYLSDNIVAGRIVFMKSWENKLETFSFLYDLQENESVDLLKEFKKDFNMRSYLDKFIRSELVKNKQENSMNQFDIKLEDYTELSISDNSLIISTKFNWRYGYHKLRIPFSELEGLLKRNSILKPVMRS